MKYKSSPYLQGDSRSTTGKSQSGFVYVYPAEFANSSEALRSDQIAFGRAVCLEQARDWAKRAGHELVEVFEYDDFVWQSTPPKPGELFDSVSVLDYTRENPGEHPKQTFYSGQYKNAPPWDMTEYDWQFVASKVDPVLVERAQRLWNTRDDELKTPEDVERVAEPIVVAEDNADESTIPHNRRVLEAHFDANGTAVRWTDRTGQMDRRGSGDWLPNRRMINALWQFYYAMKVNRWESHAGTKLTISDREAMVDLVEEVRHIKLWSTEPDPDKSRMICCRIEAGA